MYMEELSTGDHEIVSIALHSDSHNHYLLIKDGDVYFPLTTQMRFMSVYDTEC